MDIDSDLKILFHDFIAKMAVVKCSIPLLKKKLLSDDHHEIVDLIDESFSDLTTIWKKLRDQIK